MTTTKPTPKPSVRIENVTPAIADKYLGTQLHNRRLREDRVIYWIGIINRGEWRLSNDAITFDQDGHLLNGQHRLTAIVISEQTLPLVVLRHLPTAAQNIMDTGLTRQMADALKLRGEINVTALAGCLRWELRLRRTEADPERQVTFDRSRDRITISQMLDLFDAGDADTYREAVVWVQRFMKVVPLRPSCGACIYRRTVLLNAGDAREFWDGMRTGSLKAGDPRLSARNQLLNSRRSGRVGHMPDWREAALVAKTWNLWRAGEDMVQVMWKYGGSVREEFPIPE
jgi:hypothetical protein